MKKLTYTTLHKVINHYFWTSALARTLILDGTVYLNGEKCTSPEHMIVVGDHVEIKYDKGSDEFTCRDWHLERLGS